MLAKSDAKTTQLDAIARPKSIAPWLLNLITAIILTFGYNQAFITSLQPIATPSLFTKLLALLFLVNLFICHLGGLGKGQKTWLLLLLLISACSQYFMLTYGILIDTNMLKNALETDAAEINALLSYKMLPYMLFNWLLPATLILAIPRNTDRNPILRQPALRYSLPLIMILTLILGLVATQYQTYAGVFRQYRQLKHQVLPLSAISASLSLLKIKSASAMAHSTFAAEAVQQLPAAAKPRLVIMVLGETVRADHMAINGYGRNTTPRLDKRSLINFGSISACGTATAISVPCLLSHLTKDTYDETLAKHSDNLLDVLQRAGLKVIWRNNNSGCKSMCDRVEQDINFAIHSSYACADGECPDLALLEGLEQKILQQDRSKSLFIVLHQQGNHGPEYYKRSLEQDKVFLPECRTNLLSDCEQQHIINAYDNAIVSTDILLDNSISLLEKFSDDYDAGLFYVSDHGESLGENGVYLHGLPYWMAPTAQTKVPMLFWLSDEFRHAAGLDSDCLQQKTNLSHDNIFDTMLSLFAVKTTTLRPELDLTTGCRTR